LSDRKNKQQLEDILHPKIQRETTDRLQALASQSKPPAYAIIVVPLLIEADYHKLINRVLVVVADEQTRIARIRQRDNRTVSEIHSIIANQIDDEKRCREANEIIENNSDINNLAIQVKKLHERYSHLSSSVN